MFLNARIVCRLTAHGLKADNSRPDKLFGPIASFILYSFAHQAAVMMQKKYHAGPVPRGTPLFGIPDRH